MKSWAITTTNIKRLMRDPSTIFFVFVFPMLLVLVLGASFGGGFTPKVGLLLEGQGQFAQAFSDELTSDDDFTTVDYDDRDLLLEDVERGVVQMAVVIPADYDTKIMSGQVAEIEFVGRADQSVVQYRSTIEAVVAGESAIVRAARLLETEGLNSFEEGTTLARAMATGSTGPEVEVSASC